MRQASLKKLRLLGNLNLPSAVAVPDALTLVEELIPSIGSMLVWSNSAGEVAGGYSTLVGMEERLFRFATQRSHPQLEKRYYDSIFQDPLHRKLSAQRCSDSLQIPFDEFSQSGFYREVMAPYGVEDWARVTVTADGRPVAVLVIFRGADAPPFRQRELRILDEVAPLLGAIVEDSEDPDIPVINAGHPGQATLDSEMKLMSGSPCFHQQLAMLNQHRPDQHRPGEGSARLMDELPESIAGKLYQLADGTPRSLGIRTAWGRFQLYLEQLQNPSRYSLVTVRLVPISLQMFRGLQGLDLSERQLQVACGLAEGRSFQQMASRWRISRHSVITHAGYLYDKLSLRNKEQLMSRYVWSAGIETG